MAHEPSHFERLEENGDYPVAYKVTVKNSGDAATVGNYVLYDTPPPELTVTEVRAGAGWICTAAGQANTGTPISCESEASLAPGASSLAVTVFLQMSPSAPDTLTNGATISGGEAAAEASASDPTPVIDRPPFSVQAFVTHITDATNTNYAVAGGHPYQATTAFAFPTYEVSGAQNSVEEMSESYVELPSGFIGNPAAAARCSLAKMQTVIPTCPPASRVGTVNLGVRGSVSQYPLYNVIPERGYPAEFAFKFGVYAATMYPTLRPRTGSYGVTIGVPGVARFGVTSIGLTLYGVPSARNGSGGALVPLLSNPMNCLEVDPVTRIAVDSWQHPGRTLPNIDGSLDFKTPDLSDPNWKTASAPAPPATECDAPGLTSQFHPSIDAKPTQPGAAVQADQPSGLAVGLDFPQSNDPTDLTTSFDPAIPQAPQLKDATVTLPAGVAISPSAADGLGGCSDRAADPASDQIHYDTTIPVSCPDASKIGTATATSPLLAAHEPVTDVITGSESIGGDVYLIKPHPGDLPQSGDRDGTFRVLIQLSSPRNGIVLKLPGTVRVDRRTGQLTASLVESPQLPLKHLEVHLNSGPRALLATPATCGTFTTTSDLVPWSTPGTPDAAPSSSFDVSSGPNGSPCAATPGQRPFAPRLSAGTESAEAGATSPFVLRLTRDDGEQELSSLELAMPPGLTANLAGVPYCPEAAIAAAAASSAAAERAGSSCPAASQIGTVTAGAGPGSHPFYLGGRAYLAGPYKGAPLSFVFVAPALAGPFDLGSIVVRAAVFVNPETARVTVRTDPIPQILDGVPLRIRSIAARLDRPGFTRNPTDCEAKSVSASVAGASGAIANPANYFQVGDCAKLGFRPRLALRLLGPTHRSAHPKLRATLRPRRGDANIGRATVTLPKTELLENAHIQTICTRVRYAAGACPAGSVYGYAKAWSPLLDKPLEGPVYLRSSNRMLPDLVASLGGQIHVDLVGHIDSVRARIRSTFEAIPDVPVSKFVLTMKGGRKGLLVNNTELCKAKPRALVKFTAQNGMTHDFKPVVRVGCGKK